MIVCDHKDSARTGLVCEHLLVKTDSEHYKRAGAYHRCFSGKGLEFAIVCPACAARPDGGAASWRVICESCVQDIACGTRFGDIGSPQFPIRNTSLHLEHETFELPPVIRGVRIAEPMGRSSKGDWLIQTENLDLAVISPRTGQARILWTASDSKLDPDEVLSLKGSSDGRFAAVASTHGQHGYVLDVESSEITMRLDRGNYRNEHCAFPIAFLNYQEQTLIVHGSDWNRLDVSQPATGKLLTNRGPTSYSEGEERPRHFLNYFHCGLSISPNDEWIVDNGWAWQPVGVVTTWNVKTWLSSNVWESEDGSSLKGLCVRDYYWDGPVCWINNTTLAVWGYGDDNLLPAVRLFDVVSGEERKVFAGPAQGPLAFHDWLFSWPKGKPFTVWDIDDGARIFEDSAFSPLGYHPGTQEFLSIADGKIRLSKLK